MISQRRFVISHRGQVTRDYLPVVICINGLIV